MGSSAVALPPGFQVEKPAAPQLPPGFQVEAPAQSSAVGDFLSGAASKLNPVNIVRDMADTLKSASDHPIDTALSVLAHPYLALKRAKEALDAGKLEEASAHLQSAFDPTGFATEGSTVKAATPGHRAEGFGELLGAGLNAYLGGKLPEIAAAGVDAAKSAAKAGASIPPIPGAVQDVAGVGHPAAAHAIGLFNRVTNALRKIMPETAEETPATPPPLPLSALPPARAPIWNGPPGRPATPLDITPIPGKLPSGRVPGAPAIDPATGNIVQNAGGAQFQAPAAAPPQPPPEPTPPAPAPAPPPAAPAAPAAVAPPVPQTAPAIENPRAAEFAARARAPKVSTLADTLHQGDISADDAARLTPGDWQRLSRGLGINNPSPYTINAVLDELRSREAAADLAKSQDGVQRAADLRSKAEAARRARVALPAPPQ